MPLKKADVLADEKALFGDAERLFDVREHHVGGAQAALGEVPGGRGEVDDAAVLRGIGPLDERVGHHVLREPGARTGDGGVAVADEDDVGFARHEGLEVDFLGRAGVDDLRVVLVLREPGKGRGLRQGGHAVAEAPGVHGVEDGVVKDGDALRVLRNDDLDGRVLLVEGLHREGFGRLDGDGGQGGGRDEERGERAGEHGLHGFPVRMVTVVERCAWLNEV